jgi:hypothetical protein
MSAIGRTGLGGLIAGAIVVALAAPAAADASYGAIAVNPNTGDAGISHGHATKRAAKQRAKNECMGRCRIALWVRNFCGAVVSGRTRFVTGFGPTKGEAIRRARKHARRKPAPLVAWVCSR